MNTPAAATPGTPAAPQPNGKAATPPAAAAPAQAAPKAAAAAEPAAGTPPPAATEPKVDTRLAIAHRKLEQQLKTLQPELEQLRALAAGLKDPVKRFELLEQQGVSYEEWTRAKLKAAGHDVPDAEPIDPRVEKELKRIADLEAKLKEKEESEQQLQQQAKQREALSYINQKLKDGGDAYALTAAMGGGESIMREYIRQRAESGDEPDESAIFASVEKGVEQNVKTSLNKLLSTAKGIALVEAALAAVKPPAASTEQDEDGVLGLAAGQRQKRNGAKSVSNELAAQRGEQVDERKLPLSERRARIFNRIKDVS